MKKSELKPIIKAIIKEATLANTFKIMLFGDKPSREQVGNSFVKTGKGKLKTQVAFPSPNSTAYTVWDGDVLKTMDTILQGLGWKRRGMKGRDIIWTAPNWNSQTQKNTDWNPQTAQRGSGTEELPVTAEEQILEVWSPPPGSEPGKWQKISGISGQKKLTPEAKQFAKEVRDKMADKMRKQGQMGYNDLDALTAIIEFKLTKEGWTKSGISKAALGTIMGNPDDPNAYK